jgi:hypothetical protein
VFVCVGVGGGGVDVLIKGELVLVGPPGMVVSVGEKLVEVGPELVEVGETSADGVNVWVKLSGNGVSVIGDEVMVGGWGVIEATPAKKF